MGAFPSVPLQESEQELEKFCRYLHRSSGDEPFTRELRGTAPVPAQHRPGLVRAWLRVRHSQASTARFPPVSHGRTGVSLQARSRDPRWGARCRATPSPGHRLGGSCAQRSDKALIAESRHQLSSVCSSSWKPPLCLRLSRSVNYTVLVSKVDITMPFLLQLEEFTKALVPHSGENKAF